MLKQTRPWPLRFASWLILLALLLCVTQTPAPVQAQSPGAEIVRLVNEFRAQLGLPSFTYSATLANAAQQQANYLAETGIYTHTGYNGSSPQSRAAALGYPGRVSENIVGGTNLSPNQGLIWWQNSPTHYNTIASQQYSEIGFGFAQAGGQNFYTIVVGNPAGQLPSRNSGNNDDNSSAALQVIPITLAQPDETGAIIHTVQEGQSLWMIGAHYDVPLSEIYYLNSLSERDYLQAGDQIYIKLGEGQEPPPTPMPPSTHTVRSGETLWNIAARYNLNLADLLWYNGLSGDAIINPGDELKIRLLEGEAPPPTPTPTQKHIVKAGDSLWGIALGYNLELDQLLAWNEMTVDALLLRGDELWIIPPPAPPTPEATPTAVLTSTPVLLASDNGISSLNAVDTTEPTAVSTPVPTATSTPQAPATSNAPDTGLKLPDWFASIGSIFLGLGLIGLAGGTFLFLSRPR